MRKMMSIATPPTAVFVADPLTACGAINEAHKLGLRIPEEMSILGFDDSDTRFSIVPTMTAICQDSRELGKLAYQFLIQRCECAVVEQSTGVGRAWLEINHTTAQVPSRSVRILPSGDRLPVAG
jgi:DNA-binding LacI/PurR family transcriptional regulator